MLAGSPEPGGDQQRTELVAVQGDGMRLVPTRQPAAGKPPYTPARRGARTRDQGTSQVRDGSESGLAAPPRA